MDFTDITANTDLGTAALDPKTVSHGFGKALVTNASGAPAQSVVADLNGDGFPDIATANAVFGSSTVAVFRARRMVSSNRRSLIRLDISPAES